MAETQHLDRTTIELAGKVDSSLGGATRIAESNLKKIETTGAHATNSLERGFAKASASINSGLGNLGSKMIGLGVGLATAIAGFSTLSGFIDQALEAASEEKVGLTTRRLKTALQNNRFIARQGTEAINEQAEAIGKTAEKMELYSGTSAAIFRAAYTTLAVHKATSREVNVIATGMADYLALTKGVSATLDDANELSNKIVAAVETHKLGRFARELGITPEDQARWKGLTSNMERLIFLQEHLERIASGQGAAQAGSLAGRLLLAQNERRRIMAEYGEIFRGIQLKWQTAGNEMMKTALPFARPVIEDIGKAFDKLSDTIHKVFADLNTPEMKGYWSTWAKDIGTVLTPLQNWFDSMTGESSLTSIAKKTADEIKWQIDESAKQFKTIGDICNQIGAVFVEIDHRIDQVLEKAVKIYDQIHSILFDKPVYFPLPKTSGGAAAADQNPLFKSSRQIAEEQRNAASETSAVTKSQRILEQSLFNLESAARAATNALEFIGSGMGNFPISGAGGSPIGGLSDPGESAAGFKVYEEYPWEGHSSNYGPAGNKLGEGYGVGLGPEVMAKYGLNQGDQVHIPGVGWRKVNESSARGHGIEFFTSKRGEYTGKGERMKIDQIRKGDNPAAPVGHTINSTPTIHIHGSADKSALSSLDGILKDHSRHLLELLQKANDSDYRTSFA